MNSSPTHQRRLPVAVVTPTCVAVLGLVTFVAAWVWNRFPTDGANIGAGILGLLGLALLIVGGLAARVALLVVAIIRRRRNQGRAV